MDKYRLRVRLARRLVSGSAAVIVVIDRYAILSNLRWEVEAKGKMATDPAFRAFVRLVLADFLESTNAQGGDAAITIMSRDQAVSRGVAPAYIKLKKWPPHRLILKGSLPNMPSPIDLLTDVAGTSWETQEGVTEAVDEVDAEFFQRRLHRRLI